MTCDQHHASYYFVVSIETPSISPCLPSIWLAMHWMSEWSCHSDFLLPNETLLWSSHSRNMDFPWSGMRCDSPSWHHQNLLRVILSCSEGSLLLDLEECYKDLNYSSGSFLIKVFAGSLTSKKVLCLKFVPGDSRMINKRSQPKFVHLLNDCWAFIIIWLTKFVVFLFNLKYLLWGLLV